MFPPVNSVTTIYADNVLIQRFRVVDFNYQTIQKPSVFKCSPLIITKETNVYVIVSFS